MATDGYREGNEGARASVHGALARLLGNTMVLSMKTLGYHWNVVGPEFVTLHALFEEQYRELSGAADEIAERIRALGYGAPGSYGELVTLATISESPLVAEEASAEAMLRAALSDHGSIAEQLRGDAAKTAHTDGVSADLFVRRGAAHEKTAWMLRALLVGPT